MNIILSNTAPTVLPIGEKGSNLSQLIARFIAEQDAKKTSKALYERTLKLYFSWVAEKAYNLKDITRVEVLQYKEDLLESGRSGLTISSYLTVVRKFYEWTEANRLYPNVAKGVKAPKRLQQFRKKPLNVDQGRDLLNYYQTQAKRDYAIVNLLIRTGLRTIEVVRANIEDIDYKGGKRILWVHRKGRDEKDKFVVLTDKAYQPIAAYLESREGAQKEDPLFISNSNNSKGKRLTTRTVSKLAKDGLKAIGLDSNSYTAHSLRHTTAVTIRRGGGTGEDVQATLGHASPVTSQIYDWFFREEERLKNAPEELIDNLL